jgi:hypothetical protein
MDSWQPACLCFQLGRPRTIGRLQCVQISLDALLDLLLTLVDLTRREVAIPSVDGFELILSRAK